MAEGAPLLRAYRVKPIEGSNPSLSAIFHMPFNKLHNGDKKKHFTPFLDYAKGN